MASTSTVAVAKQNGHERKHGIADVREAEVMNLAQLASSAFREAERLAEAVHHDAFDVRIGRQRAAESTSQEVDVEYAQASVFEALLLIETGEHYLRMLQDVLRAVRGEPSF